jgi:hypothetical protein
MPCVIHTMLELSNSVSFSYWYYGKGHPIMRTHRLAWSLVLASLIAFAIPSVVSATEPVVLGPVHEEGTERFAKCKGFTILDEYVLDYTLRQFFDQDGRLVKMEETVSGTDTFINSKTGKAIAAPFHNNVLIDPQTRFGANAGVIFKVTVPGAGAVFLDVGRLVTNQAGTEITFEAGPHQFIDGDLGGLCAVLAGNP